MFSEDVTLEEVILKPKQLKKKIITIQSKNGANRSSIIRTISQILIGLSKNTIINVGELGLQDEIASVVQIDTLKIGVGSQKSTSNNAREMIENLISKSCDAILCTIQTQNGKTDFDDLALANGYEITDMESNWSDKLEVNYLSEDQVNQIIETIRSIQH